MVLRLVPRVGQQAAGGQQVLQRHAAHAGLHAGPHAPGVREGVVRSKAIRLTWRATEKNKINFFADPQRDCHCPALTASGSVNAPEAFFSYKLKPAGLYQVTWSSP